MLEGLSLKIRQFLTMEATNTILMSMSSPGSKRGNRVLVTLTLRGVKHLEEEDLSPRMAMEVRCNVLERTVLSVVVLTVESSDRALMPASVPVRVGLWLESAHRIEVRLEVILILGLIHRVQQ